MGSGFRAPTERYSGLWCLLCGRSVTPMPQGGELTFLCSRGHEMRLSEYLKDRGASLATLEELLESWEAQVRSLSDSAADAMLHGCFDVAEIILRNRDHLQGRIDQLKRVLEHGESAA